VRKIFLDARALLEDKTRWTKHTTARDASGRPCGVFQKEAHSFCLAGAIMKAAGTENFWSELGIPFSRKAIARGYNGVGHFNDELGHEEVLKLLDEVISETAP
jgi:hypothetical protein